MYIYIPEKKGTEKKKEKKIFQSKYLFFLYNDIINTEINMILVMYSSWKKNHLYIMKLILNCNIYSNISKWKYIHNHVQGGMV